MARDPGLEAVVSEHLDGIPDIHGKRLFGGWCWLKRGHLLCGARNGGMLVRLGPGQDGWALDRKGVEPMTVGPRLMPGWVWARGEALADDDFRRRLLEAALAFVATLPDEGVETPARPRRASSRASAPRRRTKAAAHD